MELVDGVKEIGKLLIERMFKVDNDGVFIKLLNAIIYNIFGPEMALKYNC